MSSLLMAQVWTDAKCNGSELLVLLAFADASDDSGANIHLSMSSLSQKTRLSEIQVRRIVQSLIRKGMVALIKKGGWHGESNQPNEYEIISMAPTSPIDDAGYIYLVQGEGTDWYKIGITKSPRQRIKLLGTKTPFPIRTIACYDVDSPQDAETWWHEAFSHKRAHGEWFELDEHDILLFDAQEGRPIV